MASFTHRIGRWLARLTLTAGLAAATSGAHAQGIPTYDNANFLIQGIITTVSWVDQADQMLQQIQNLEDNLAQLKTETSKLDLARALGTILNDPNIHNQLPIEMQTASTLLSQGGAFSGSRLTAINSVLSAYGLQNTVNGIPVTGGQIHADILSKMQAVLTSAQTRNDEIDQLASEVDGAPDAKASMDLVNRNVIEQTRTSTDLMQTMATIEANRQAEQLRTEADNQNRFTAMKARAAADATALGWR